MAKWVKLQLERRDVISKSFCKYSHEAMVFQRPRAIFQFALCIHQHRCTLHLAYLQPASLSQLDQFSVATEYEFDTYYDRH